MRNLYISTYLAPYRMDFCAYLSSQFNCEVYHYVRNSQWDAMLLDTARFDNHWLNVGYCMGKVYAKGLRQLLQSARPEYVFIQEFSLISIQLLHYRKRLGFKLISLCDDSLDMIQGNDFSRFHRLARRIVPRYLDNIIVPSMPVARWYRQRFGKGLVMPIIADEIRLRKRLADCLPSAKALRNQLGIEPCIVFGFVGRLVSLKNISRLIDAFSSLDFPAHLLIVGDGPERAALEEMAAGSSSHITFTGFRYGDDLLPLYQLIDVLVLPSTQEAFGAVTGEALTAGCRVLVSRLAGSATLVREGNNGYIIDPCSVDDIREKMCIVATELNPEAEVVLRPNLLTASFGESIKELLSSL